MPGFSSTDQFLSIHSTDCLTRGSPLSSFAEHIERTAAYVIAP